MSLVDAHPLVQAADQKLADCQRRLEEFEERVGPLAQADAEAEEAYARAVDAALLNGGQMPEPPVRKIPPGRDVELRLAFIQEKQELTQARLQVVAAAYQDVLRQVHRQAAKVIKDARPVVAKLSDSMAELAELLGAVKEVRSAKNTESTDGHRDYHDAKLDVELFIRLVAAGEDPTSILDLTGAGRGVQPRNTGMTLAEVRQLLGSGAK